MCAMAGRVRMGGGLRSLCSLRPLPQSTSSRFAELVSSGPLPLPVSGGGHASTHPYSPRHSPQFCDLATILGQSMQSLKGSPAKNGVLAVRRNCLIVNEILDLPVWLGCRAKPVCFCASVLYASSLTGDSSGSIANSGWKIISETLRKHRPPGGQPSAELPAAARRSMRPSYLPHAVLSRSILRLSFVILSQHLLTWCKP